MPEFISALRPYLELGSFTATIVLVIGLIFARYQLVAFSRDVSTRNERLAKEKSIEATTRYLTEYVRLCGLHYEKQAELNISLYRGEVGDFSISSLGTDGITEAVIEEIQTTTVLEALNELEIISSYFVTGVADEQTGFRVIGRSFCSNVRFSYLTIAVHRGNEQAQPFWYNIVALYHLWAPRLTREELKTESDRVSDAIAGLPADRPIAPIGC